ncbi:hypothetical protein [Pseudoroseomonas cervicalis]|uniref:hypothetical protein n=1 Tax=Teichococcus cervicalis TaxID=204525 RepID=UPI0022F187F2|nr:hypothetical protein [Pseudoroseomonas cervicalis]WBV44151.1 hypothetical protein PFY06_06190 [Pseudoroseomonas cervicalis]
MPFDPRGLSSLASTDSFTLWLYVTTDTRAAVLAPGYFAAAATRLQPGHLIVLQSADSLTFIPVLSNNGVGNGLVLNASAPPLRLNAFADLAFDFSIPPVAAVARSVALDPLPSGLYTGRSFTVAARTSGPVATLVFSLLNAAGAVVAGPVSVPVASGSASTSFTAPDPGSGYRIRVVDAAEPLAAQSSPFFVVTEPYALLTEAGGSVLAADGGELLL